MKKIIIYLACVITLPIWIWVCPAIVYSYYHHESFGYYSLGNWELNDAEDLIIQLATIVINIVWVGFLVYCLVLL